MKKRTKIKIFKYITALIVLVVGYFYFGLDYVPSNLYEAQTMKSNEKEAYYVENWCKTGFGIREFMLLDKTRVDCLTKDYAIEFDFAHKWAESIGQALYYSKMTNKNPAVVLILTKPEDIKYAKRIEKAQSDIKIFLINAY